MKPRVVWTPRDEKMAVFLDREHFRFRPRPEAVRQPEEVELEPAWGIDLSAPLTPLTRRMMGDFRRFCEDCLGVILSDKSDTRPRVVWRLSDPLVAEPFDRQDPEVEAFEIAISDREVEIHARHERGLLQGTHYLEWMLADRGGPFLAKETSRRRPSFMPRISNGVFIPAYQSLEDSGRYSEEYLGLMSHYGVNGIHLFVDFWEVFRSPTLPELASPGYDAKIEALRSLARRTLAFGIDIYLHINTPPLLETHAVFQAHPDVRGARVEIFTEELSGRPWHNLCSGSEKVHAAYAEALESLFAAAPEVAGMVMIIGGECFFHCFTRPADAGNGETNCPHCRGKAASAEVARLTNLAARALKRTGAHKSLFAWPYSALIWSSQDPSELDWIRNLEPSVSVLANFDCGDGDQTTGGKVSFFDYNIKCIGPSRTFARQSQALSERGRPVFAKTETTTTADAFFVPYLPLYFRWYSRFASMKRNGVAGFIGQWRFYGMNGSPPEEMLYRLNWDDIGCEDMLRIRCRRDFHLGELETEDVLKGWRCMSDAWESYPYSAMTSGERAVYMRGPFYLGPAHPLIFDVQGTYRLPPSFSLLRGDLAELAGSEEERQELQQQAKPRYVSDLLTTLPFGTEPYLALVKGCRKEFERGLSILRSRLGDRGDRARLELNVCEAMASHLRSLENVMRFYALRDRLQGLPCTAAQFREQLDILAAILSDEMANAEHMLPILHEDSRIGYGHCYGAVYDSEMVLAKIAQCRYVREVELPRFSKVVRFHIWGESP